MSDWLEVRIPISPRDHYFNRIRLIAHSIRSLGGPYADVRVRVSVGADQDPEDLYARLPWSRDAGVDWVWVDRSEFRRWRHTPHEYIATMMERFRPPFSTRQILMLDADVLVMRQFDELADLVDATPGVAAMMAHGSPFQPPRRQTRTFDLKRIFGRRSPDHLSGWQRLFALSGIPTPPFVFEHSGWSTTKQDPSLRYGPPYFNTGVVLAPASILERLYAPYMRALDTVRNAMATYFFEQIALTLALLETGITTHILPPRYNFPNQPQFDITYPDELKAVRFLHFLRRDVVGSASDFETVEAIQKLAARDDLTGSNDLLRCRVAALLPSMIAEREYVAEEAR